MFPLQLSLLSDAVSYSLNARSRSRARLEDPEMLSHVDLPTFIVAKNPSQFSVDSVALASGSRPAGAIGDDWYKLPALEREIGELHI